VFPRDGSDILHAAEVTDDVVRPIARAISARGRPDSHASASVSFSLLVHVRSFARIDRLPVPLEQGLVAGLPGARTPAVRRSDAFS